MLGTPVKPERAIERRIGNPRWVKGVSANPGRRPAVVRELRDGAQAEGLNCIQTLIKIRDNEDFPPTTRIAACNSLLDRGYGRPVQGLAIRNLLPLPDPTMIRKQMSNAEAADAYFRTLQQGQRDLDRKLIEGAVIDVTPEQTNGEDQSWLHVFMKSLTYPGNMLQKRRSQKKW
jgi:hypothetical protein